MKWFLAVGVVVLLALFVGWQRSGVKSSYVNGLPQYSLLPNREFIFERDCYIFAFRHRSSEWPFIGAHELVPALPVDVSEKNIGADLPDVRILGVLRTGTLIKLVSVRRDEGRAATSITFEVLLLDTVDQKYLRLDAFHLLDHTPEKDGAAPRFLESYIVPRIRK
jgi:hypothetical protein